MSAAEFSRFDELVSRYLDGALTAADAAELFAALAESPLAARFLETTRLNSEIAGMLAAPVPDAAMVELVRADIEKSLASADPPAGARLRIGERTRPIVATQPTVVPLHPMAQRRKPALRTLAWAAVFLVFAGLTAVFLLNGTRRAEAPAITSVQGEVRLLGATGERVVKKGERWQSGETLKTVGPNSAVTVTFGDETRLDFGGNNVAINQSTKEERRVELEHGAMQGAVKKQPAGRPFIFATSEAEAIVVGTTLRFIVGAHHTRLEVSEGEVRFRRRHDGVEITVKAGQFAVVAPNVPFVAKPLAGDPHHL
jgi:ferric-dicitrate binding protein FerR (iron transport regulator)